MSRKKTPRGARQSRALAGFLRGLHHATVRLLRVLYSSSQVDKRKVGQSPWPSKWPSSRWASLRPLTPNCPCPPAHRCPFRTCSGGKRRAHAGFVALRAAAHWRTQQCRLPGEAGRIQGEIERALAPEIRAQRCASECEPRRSGHQPARNRLLRKRLGNPARFAPAIPSTALACGPEEARRRCLRIEGHTDNVPIHTCQFQSNWELSTARATDFIKLFVTQYDFSPDRLAAAGYAEYHPSIPNAQPKDEPTIGASILLCCVLGNRPISHASFKRGGTNAAAKPRRPQHRISICTTHSRKKTSMNDLNALRFSAAAFATRNDIADTKLEFTYNLQDLGRQVHALESLPSFPVILSRLMDLLARPPIETDFDEVIELILGDSAIAARCVSMANSASFGRRRHIESVHDAVINLGLWRISEIVFSCQLPEIFHAFPQGIDSQTFWRHSLACPSLANV